MAHVRLLISCQISAVKRSGLEVSLDAGQRRRWEEVASRMCFLCRPFSGHSPLGCKLSLSEQEIEEAKRSDDPKKERFHVWPHLVTVVSVVVFFC